MGHFTFIRKNPGAFDRSLMNQLARRFSLLLGFLLIPFFLLWQADSSETSREQAAWPARDWLRESPGKAGMDEKILADFADDMGNGKYGLIDSFESELKKHLKE